MKTQRAAAGWWLEMWGRGVGRNLGRTGTGTKSIVHAIRRTVSGAAVLFVLIANSAARAQDQPQAPPKQETPAGPENPPVVVSVEQEQTQKNPYAPCIQPPPVVRWQDYQGPFAKVVGAFGRKLERK